MVEPLRPLQKEAVEWATALPSHRGILADPTGAGKTRVSLETASNWGARKIVVSTTAAMKGEWAEQVHKWMPDWTATIVEGRTKPFLGSNRVTIVNHDIAGARLTALRDLKPDTLIIDELHHMRNHARQRTDAMLHLASSIPQRLGLTATPIVGRHSDLISQLDIVGRLQPDFGSAWDFLRTYCYGGRKKVGRDKWTDSYDASINADELRRRLDGKVWLRRPKSLIMPELPAVQRVMVHVPLSNRAEYDRIEHELAAWMIEQRLLEPGANDEAVRARVAEIVTGTGAPLVQMNAYRHTCGRGKLKMATQWIADWLDANGPLVVFAHHRDVLQALRAAFPASVGIMGGDDPATKTRAVAAFQSGQADLFVASTEAGGEGLTLTRAAATLTVELPWTAKSAIQTEGRIARIGQTADRLLCHYLIGIYTVDQHIMNALEARAAVMDRLGVL